MHDCRVRVQPPQKPKYEELRALLGAKVGVNAEDEEAHDKKEYKEHVAPLIEQAHPLLNIMVKAAQIEASAEFKQGDAVHVWSLSRNAWVEDGVVAEVATKDIAASFGQLPGLAELCAGLNVPASNGCIVPRDSVRVVYDGGAGEKWILPWEKPLQLRRETPGAETVGAGS